MSLWRALFGPVPSPLRTSTSDGTYVEVVGIARTLPGDEPFVPPLRNVPCVVAHITYSIPRPGTKQHPTRFERLQNRPFLVVTDDGVEAVVDAAHLELKIERLSEGVNTEKSVPVGARVCVLGTVMRDGGARPGTEASFRSDGSVLKIVGSRRHPVVLLPG